MVLTMRLVAGLSHPGTGIANFCRIRVVCVMGERDKDSQMLRIFFKNEAKSVRENLAYVGMPPRGPRNVFLRSIYLFSPFHLSSLPSSGGGRSKPDDGGECAAAPADRSPATTVNAQRRDSLLPFLRSSSAIRGHGGGGQPGGGIIILRVIRRHFLAAAVDPAVSLSTYSPRPMEAIP